MNNPIITQSEINARKISNLATRPNGASNYQEGRMTSEQLKAAFDATLIFLAAKLNGLQELTATDIAEISAKIGDVNTLSVPNVTALVAAINKCWQEAYENGTNIGELQEDVTRLVNNYGNLSTDEQYRGILQRLTGIDVAIAALQQGGGGTPGGGGEISSEEIEEIWAKIGNATLTTTAQTLTGAVVELVSRLVTVETKAQKIGNGSLTTTATTLIAAVNELVTRLTNYAPLVNGKIPVSYIPGASLEYVEGYYYNGAFYSDSAHSSQITPTEGTIYVDKTTNVQYRYTGSSFLPIFTATLPLPTAATDGYILVADASGDYRLQPITSFFINVGEEGQ